MLSSLAKKFVLGALIAGMVATWGAGQAEAAGIFGNRQARNRATAVRYYQTRGMQRRAYPVGTYHVGGHVVLPTDVKPTEYHQQVLK